MILCAFVCVHNSKVDQVESAKNIPQLPQLLFKHGDRLSASVKLYLQH